MESINKSTQTTYTVYQENVNDNGKVVCFKGTQTVTHIDVDEDSPDKIVALLEYTPFSEIKENYIKIIDLPKHILKFTSRANLVRSSNAKSVLKKSSDISTKFRSSEIHLKTDNEAQTQLLVSPHLLGEDSLPIVVSENTTQTDYPEYRNRLSFFNIVQHETIPGDEESTSENQQPTTSMPTSVSYMSTVKFVSTMDMTNSKAEMKIKETLDRTVKNLEDQLLRMYNEFGEVTEEVNAVDTPEQSNEDGTIPGDSGANKRQEISCECQCVGVGGGAVPELNIVAALNSSSSSEQCNREEYINKSQNASSCPDLNEHNIRLKNSKEKIARCRCAKSDTTNSCVGFKADKVMMPMNSTAQSCCLLVDQDGDYADSYLELLAHEQIGTQTENNDVQTDSSDDSLGDHAKCKCTPAIEMPWELLSYDPKIKQKKVQCSEPSPEKEESVQLSPSTMRLKQLTVEAMGDEGLLELTEEAIADHLGDEDLTISEVERRILNIENKVIQVSSQESIHSEDSQIITRPRIPPSKPKPNQVYEPSCERHNEPYMDRLYQHFPDECEVTDPCPSHIEMPWNNIVLPKKCNIRKQYKPEKFKTKKDLNDQGKPTISHVGYSIGLNNFSSIPVENPARDESTISSNKANHVEKSFTLQGFFSEPFIPSQKSKGNNFEIPTKKSDLLLNFNDKKPTNPQEFMNIPSVSHVPPPKQTSTPSSSSQRIAILLESCKKEMEPIKDGINKLRLRIRELNLPDISSFQETPQRPGGNPCPGYTMGPAPHMPYFTPPCWSPYYPFVTPYQIPQNYGELSAEQSHSRKSRTRPKSPKPTKTRSSSFTSSGADNSDFDSPVMEKLECTCKKSTDSNLPKKQKPSKIPKPVKRRDSDISKMEVIGKKSSRSTNTSEYCMAVSDLNCGVKETLSSQNINIGVTCGETNTCPDKDLPAECSNGGVVCKTSPIECGQQENVESVFCASKKTVVRSKIRIDLNDFIPVNKYKKSTKDQSSLTLPLEVEKRKSMTLEESPECKKDGECD